MPVQSYRGGCQCGAIDFEVDADLDQTFTCNCSRCQKIGAVLTFVETGDFRLIKDGPVTEYLFNKMIVHHRFCPTCGVESYAIGKGPDGGDMIAINVTCLEDVDPRALPSRHINGSAH